MGSANPFLSVIVPVYNGGETFITCLNALVASKCQDFELIVVDDGSTDGSLSYAQSSGARTLTTGGRLGPGAARNMGAQVARGQYVCFIDADCEVNADTLS